MKGWTEVARAVIAGCVAAAAVVVAAGGVVCLFVLGVAAASVGRVSREFSRPEIET